MTTDQEKFEKELEELKKSNPLVHDLTLVFHKWQAGAAAQAEALGKMLDLMVYIAEKESKDEDK